ncbi:MAG: hypothetical protein M3R64_05120 [Pseudomonadota bacterium]|nr:hypothetical protein [Pseudomonadota bacterium]
MIAGALILASIATPLGAVAVDLGHGAPTVVIRYETQERLGGIAVPGKRGWCWYPRTGFVRGSLLVDRGGRHRRFRLIDGAERAHDLIFEKGQLIVRHHGDDQPLGRCCARAKES